EPELVEVPVEVGVVGEVEDLAQDLEGLAAAELDHLRQAQVQREEGQAAAAALARDDLGAGAERVAREHLPRGGIVGTYRVAEAGQARQRAERLPRVALDGRRDLEITRQLEHRARREAV